ncbi:MULTISPECIES: N-acetyltransferase [unclassified Haladaptatus]|uniref:GNAT family N-acetyltransferase n=1 Tax=unclassified Haladaptatus TaxID=2622732 RepID=UPI0023E7C1CF|nr:MULTISPECIES: GNAT family N-acetyltransferase [unclassified Haladaptatus]
MELAVPDTEAVEVLTDLWIALATDQRSFGSHLLPEANRPTIRAAITRFVVADTIVVARDDDAILGFVMFDLETGIYQQDVTRGVVMNIFVRPEHRGQGVGSALLAEAESRLEAAGADTVTLDVMAANDRAIQFYERHGYAAHRIQLEKHIENDNHSKEQD